MFREFGDAMVSLLLEAPFYAHVVSDLQPVVSKSVPVAAVAMTVPIKLLINQETFSQFKVLHRVGVLQHEVLHLVMEHFIRRGGRNMGLWNLATDLAVNELIEKRYLPPNAVTVASLRDSLGIRLPPRASAEAYYDILEKHAVKVTVEVDMLDGNSNCPAGSQGQSQGKGSADAQGQPQGSSSGGQQEQGGTARVRVTVQMPDGRSATYEQFDDHGQGEGQEDSIAREIARELVRQIIERAVKNCGHVPGGLEEYVKALQQTRVNWRRILARFLAGRGKMLAQPTYLRESKRYDDYPGKRKQVGMEALVAIDTSGSMSDAELADILAHLQQIRKISGTKIWVVWGDTQREGGPVPLEKVGRAVKIKGRGGTDLRWPFEIADKMRLGTVVYFTDGYGPVPEAGKVKQRVLWVITPQGRPPADYGYTVKMEKKVERAG